MTFPVGRPPMHAPSQDEGHPLGDPLGFPLVFKQWVVDYVTQELQLHKVLGFKTLPPFVTGIIPAAGTTPTSGLGFTYTHTNTSGIYVFTFSVAMPSTPIVLANMGNSGTFNATAKVTAAATTGFTIAWAGTGAAATDVPFNFLAIAVQ